jgi:UPF0042 nucleotide-binding protein
LTPRADEPVGVLLVTGMSGSGRTSALKILEDIGFEAVNNLPLALLGNLATDNLLRPEGKIRPLAIGIDIRSRDFDTEAFIAEVERLRGAGDGVGLLFLDCDDDELARRYAETRRRHPVTADRPLIDGIKHERRVLAPVRDRATWVIDTTDFRSLDLERHLRGRFALERGPGLTVLLTSFGFANGLPHQADFVFDVRFLRNPHYVPELKPLTGIDPAVADYVAQDAGFPGYFERLTGLLDTALAGLDGRANACLSIAVGCTGGRHRSVFVAERLTAWFKEKSYPVDLQHRDAGIRPTA